MTRRPIRRSSTSKHPAVVGLQDALRSLREGPTKDLAELEAEIAAELEKATTPPPPEAPTEPER